MLFTMRDIGLLSSAFRIIRLDTVVAFAMDEARRIFYSVLDVQNTEIESSVDVNYWLENPRELFFTNEIAEVGIGVADQTTLPVVKIGSRQPEPPGVRILEDEKDLFLSSTARLTADAPFQAMSDGRHIFLFRQAIAADHPDMVFKRGAEGNPITDNDGNPVPLVDRFVLSGTTLQTKMEVRFQRSRSKTRRQNRKDSLGAKDMVGLPRIEGG